MTLEEAQERILALEAQLTETQTERDSLSQNNETLSRDLEKARAFNQKLFERISQQNAQQDDDPDPEPEAPTCEAFAKTIKL